MNNEFLKKKKKKKKKKERKVKNLNLSATITEKVIYTPKLNLNSIFL